MDPVVAFYRANAEEEWGRLTRDAYHQLEFLVTHHFLARHLPPGSLVLDAGGGPGQHSLELCRRGHRVILCDLTPDLLAIARRQAEQEPADVRSRLLDIVAADIRDLSRFGDASFDAVVCTGGPISHIPDSEGRRQAVRELVRVTRPGGLVCLGVNGYLAVLRTIMCRFSQDLVDDPALPRLLSEGTTPIGEMEWHFFRADEVRALAESCGLTTLTLAGCEGLSSGLSEATNQVGEGPAKWARWCEIVLATAAEPAVVDMSEHILCFGRVGG